MSKSVASTPTTGSLKSTSISAKPRTVAPASGETRTTVGGVRSGKTVNSATRLVTTKLTFVTRLLATT